MSPDPKEPKQQRGAAFVTGAAGIIGPTICAILKREGWKVVGVGSSMKSFKLYERYHGKPVEADTLIGGDLSSYDACRKLIADAEAAQGSIGLIVNNASANKHASSIEKIDPEFFETLLKVDLLAPFYLTNAALKSLEENRGCVINISSVSAVENDVGTLVYGAAKVGLEKATATMAYELLAKGIRVNAIRVGSVPGDAFVTRFIQHLPDDLAARVRADAVKEHLAAASKILLSGRCGLPEDVGEMIAYLASERGAFINGAVIPVDGAYGMHRRQREAKGEGFRSPVVTKWLNDHKAELNQLLRSYGLPEEP